MRLPSPALALAAALLATVPPVVADELNQIMDEGVQAFFDARIPESVAAFDKLVELRPELKPRLWQRGLALYYAERYADGKDQFEVHQTANSHDVENAVWHFICVARLEGVEKARELLIPISGDDRVPMAQIHALFAGKGKPADVLAAAGAAEDPARKRNHLCYAHLYLGLYHEAMGEEELARRHMRKAALDFHMDHYMGRTALTHLKVRGWDHPEASIKKEP
jgi:lipoprotein NlpI